MSNVRHENGEVCCDRTFFMRNIVNMPVDVSGRNGGMFVRMCNSILRGEAELFDDGVYEYWKAYNYPESIYNEYNDGGDMGNDGDENIYSAMIYEIECGDDNEDGEDYYDQEEEF